MTAKTTRAGCIPAIERVAMAAMLLAMSACAPTNVEPVQSYQGARLPRPDLVIVSDFIAAPDDVRLDSGDVVSDGERLGQAIAKQLAQFFQQQGWVAAAAQ
jgi:hypothetical protein